MDLNALSMLTDMARRSAGERTDSGSTWLAGQASLQNLWYFILMAMDTILTHNPEIHTVNETLGSPL